MQTCQSQINLNSQDQLHCEVAEYKVTDVVTGHSAPWCTDCVDSIDEVEAEVLLVEALDVDEMFDSVDELDFDLDGGYERTYQQASEFLSEVA